MTSICEYIKCPHCGIKWHSQGSYQTFTCRLDDPVARLTSFHVATSTHDIMGNYIAGIEHDSPRTNVMKNLLEVCPNKQKLRLVSKLQNV